MNMWSHKKAQSLLELAIFSTSIIMLLGVLISYGMRFYYMQKVAQDAFKEASRRNAEAVIDGRPQSVTYLILEDKHIPDPSNIWGIGASMPVMSSSSVTRSYLLHYTPDTVEELPVIALDIKGTQCPGSRLSPAGSDPPCYYLTAGFRFEDNVPEDTAERYRQVYGTVSGCTHFNSNGRCTNWKFIDDDDVIKNCIEWGTPAWPGAAPPCERYGIAQVAIVDTCAGEIIDRSIAIMQCRQIVDDRACRQLCQLSKQEGSDTNCSEIDGICSHPMTVPWYCQGFEEVDPSTDRYNFPIINQLFARGSESMGLQPGTYSSVSKDTRLVKNENKTQVNTVDRVIWEELTSRRLVFLPYGSTDPDDVQDVGVVTSVSERERKTWTTPW